MLENLSKFLIEIKWKLLRIWIKYQADKSNLFFPDFLIIILNPKKKNLKNKKLILEDYLEIFQKNRKEGYLEVLILNLLQVDYLETLLMFSLIKINRLNNLNKDYSVIIQIINNQVDFSEVTINLLLEYSHKIHHNKKRKIKLKTEEDFSLTYNKIITTMDYNYNKIKIKGDS